MQNFKKYGVAVAVASVATGAMAQKVSTVDAGDAAIIPYYTAEGGRITGIHVVNTTGAAQAVKVRLRRGSDSADAMDFNVVMSPYDEWTGYVGQDDDGVFVGTSDTTCTVPKSLGETGIGRMPATYAEGASEGYIEVIGMGQAVATEPAAVAATHVKGTPKSCAEVEANFLRVADKTATGTVTRGVATVPGVHYNNLTSNGTCAKVVSTVTACKDSAAVSATNLTDWTDTSDQALKVSYFIREGATEGEGGLEVGANAVHIEGFTDAFAAGSTSNGAVLTNQVRQVFDANSTPPNQLVWDPQNFEMPNLGQAYGNTSSSVVDITGSGTIAAGNQAHFDAIREALDVDAFVNDWADNDKADADWIVTLPGQYAMRDGVCQRYAVEGPKTACANYTAATVATPLATDKDQLPLYLVDGSAGAFGKVYAFTTYDREEAQPASATSTTSPGIDFSPSSNETEGYETVYLRREVNVVSWGSDDGTSVGSAAKQSATADTHGLVQVVGTGDLTEGWGKLELHPVNTAPKPAFIGKSLAAGDHMSLAVQANGGCATAATSKPGQDCYLDWGTTAVSNTAAVGLAVWKREFSDNASANYGRAIEHSVVTSSGSCGYRSAPTLADGSADDRCEA